MANEIKLINLSQKVLFVFHAQTSKTYFFFIQLFIEGKISMFCLKLPKSTEFVMSKQNFFSIINVLFLILSNINETVDLA